MTVLVALGGAAGSVLGYRLIANGVRWTTMLSATLTVSLLLGCVARAVRISGEPGYAVFPIALLGPVVSFVGVYWMLHHTPRSAWWRPVVVVAGGVAAAVLGYLSTDLLGLAYIKIPRIG